MIKMTEGGLIDIWPDKESPQIKALSYTVQRALQRVKAYADQAMCYSDVDHLPEEILDYFAVEMCSMYYEQKLPIEQKREIVKNTLKWYMHAGTPATVEEMVAVVLGEGKVVEWFKYTNPPYTPGTFDIVTPAKITKDNLERLESIIETAKNARSHIREIVIIRDVHPEMHAAIYQVAMQESVVLNYIHESKDASQPTNVAAGISTAREYEIRNHIKMNAELSARQKMVNYGSVNEITTCATNHAADNTNAQGGKIC